LRDDVPPGLSEVIDKMLRKGAADRFHDGSAVVEALVPFEVVRSGSDVGSPAARGRAFGNRGVREYVFQSGLTTNESRVLTVLVGQLASAAAIPLERLSELATGAGAELVTLPGGEQTFVAYCRDQRAPKEQAQTLARLALLSRQECTELGLRLATGRTRAHGSVPRGDVLEAALAALRDVGPGEIGVDATSEALLGTRFVIKSGVHGVCLVSEYEREQARTLLGKQTPWVGRQRELVRLRSTLSETIEENVARGILVTAPPGMGKSRLCHEFLQSVSSGPGTFAVLIARGDAMSARSPFALLGPALRRAAQIQDGEPITSRREKLIQYLNGCVAEDAAARLALFIGEIAGVPFRDEDDEALRAARKDPMLLGQLVRTAFCDWLRAKAVQQPLIFVVEDLHWGDVPSIQLIDAALNALAETQFFFLALARPEVHTSFPQLWRHRPVEEMRLNPLTKGAASELVRYTVGDRLDFETIATIVAKSEGNAFYLEELIRCAVEGNLANVPENVLGMVQARLHALDQEARWVLRAASVFGEAFWGEGVQALLGGQLSGHDVDAWLHSLQQLELIGLQSCSRLPGQTEYKFRHALVRDAAYELSTDEDRVVGHLLAGQFLLQTGEQDAVVLAEHFLRGDDRVTGITWLTTAATQAFEGNDLDLVLTCVQRAVAAGAEGAQLGELRSLESQACYWKSEYNQAKASGGRALDLLSPGGAGWFRALGSAMVSAARAGDVASVDAYFARALATPCTPGAEAEELICLCRGTFQLIFRGEFQQADAALGRIEGIADLAEDLDALTRAQVHHVQGVRAAHVGDVVTFLKHLQVAVAYFEKASDTRNVCLERTTLGWCLAELGDLDSARQQCESNLSYCRALGAKQAVTYAKVNLGYTLSLIESEQRYARQLLTEAIEECQAVQNSRLEGWARAHLAFVEYRAGDAAAQVEQAKCATEKLMSTPGLRAWAQASHGRALLSQGDAEAGLCLAKAALETLQRMGGLLQGESLPPLIVAECYHALGRHEEAHAAIADAVQRLERRAQRLGSGAWRTSFFALHDNQRTLKLASLL
jgi:tetratricopeptide (TPR) repeat protein